MSYVGVLSGFGKAMILDSVPSLDDVVVGVDDVTIDQSGPYHLVAFSESIHKRIDHSMWRSIIVRSLDRTIGYRFLMAGIKVLWKPQGLPYRYYSKALFMHIDGVIGKLVKIDYYTHVGDRGCFAWLAVMTREPEKDHDVTNVSRDSVSPFQQVNEVTDVVYDPWMILANRRCRSPKTSTTAYGLSLASEVATRLTKVDSRQGHSRGKAGNSQEVSTVKTQDVVNLYATNEKRRQKLASNMGQQSGSRRKIGDSLWFSQGVASDTIDGTCDSQRVMLVAESGGGVIEAPNERKNRPQLVALMEPQDNPQFEEFLCESWDTSLDVRANICAFQIKGIGRALHRNHSDFLVQLDSELRDQLDECYVKK
ncbi:hypothetical protein V6N12_030060 [Hibiscus sabdariffa]|uniref:Uncharacterized protein n=1 Tax=Hibiscus sabdariffa TaxID=183260 RepID=A0ABR2CJY5_9ROSI